MKELLDLILQNITTHPEEAVVDESTDGDVQVYTISVNPEDMGRVIGKDGKVIRAIRSLAHVVAIRQGKRFRVTLNDAQEPTESNGETPPEPKSPQKTEAEPAKEESEDLIAGAIDMSETETNPPEGTKATE